MPFEDFSNCSLLSRIIWDGYVAVLNSSGGGVTYCGSRCRGAHLSFVVWRIEQVVKKTAINRFFPFGLNESQTLVMKKAIVFRHDQGTPE